MGLDERRRRLLYRCWHRGTRETDLIMGPFADAWIGELSDIEIADFERLSDVPDPEIYAWVTGEIAAQRIATRPALKIPTEFGRTNTHVPWASSTSQVVFRARYDAERR